MFPYESNQEVFYSIINNILERLEKMIITHGILLIAYLKWLGSTIIT